MRLQYTTFEKSRAYMTLQHASECLGLLSRRVAEVHCTRGVDRAVKVLTSRVAAKG
jgi:hypothetical protein